MSKQSQHVCPGSCFGVARSRLEPFDPWTHSVMPPRVRETILFLHALHEFQVSRVFSITDVPCMTDLKYFPYAEKTSLLKKLINYHVSKIM